MKKFVKAVTGLLATVTMVTGLSLGTVFAAASDPNEPNDTYDKATSITLGKTYSGEIGDYYIWLNNKYKEDDDWFKVKVTKGKSYRFTFSDFTSKWAPTTLLIDAFYGKDAAKNEKTGEYLSGRIGKEDYYDFEAKESGTFYIKVHNFFNYASKNGKGIPNGQLKSTAYKFSLKESPVKLLQYAKSDNEATVVCGSKILLKINGVSNKPTWTSSNTKIATVDASGNVKGIQAGACVITGKIGNVATKCNLLVQYKDVKNTGDFWYTPTYYLTNKDVVKGYDKQTKFKPGNDCTRAQMVTFLWRLAGSPAPKSTSCKFTDVKKSDYFYKAVLWAVEKGITTGTSKTKFSPKGVCTRAQTFTFLWRMAGQPAPKTKTYKFKDVKAKDYFYKAVLWASEKKIVAGYKDGTFKPKGKCLRRQMVTFLYKYDNNINKKK